jgi:hypothetical protein
MVQSTDCGGGGGGGWIKSFFAHRAKPVLCSFIIDSLCKIAAVVILFWAASSCSSRLLSPLHTTLNNFIIFYSGVHHLSRARAKSISIIAQRTARKLFAKAAKYTSGLPKTR